jgi:arylformamidase
VKVFLDYTQEELDRAYDQRAWAANAPEVIARYTSASQAAKAKYKFETRRYGPDDDETMDVFQPTTPMRGAGAPIHVFIHGGAWRSLTKDDSAFAAPAFVDNGVIYVALNFSLIPKVRLPEMAEQCRRAIAWIAKNAPSFGGDAGRIFLSGHSSGGHLAGVMLTTEWARYGAPATAIKAGLVVSGMYDLQPVLISARSSYVKIDAEEEAALSPLRQLDKVRCPIVVAFGAGESPEFKRHARAFAEALKRTRHASTLVEGSELNHFEIVETLAESGGLLGRIALEQIRRAA